MTRVSARGWGALVLGTLTAISAAGCGADEPEPVAAPGANVVVVVLDCLRADHMGVYGYHRDTTPQIDHLAAESVVFEQAIAPSNWTKPSVVSLLSGLYVSEHGVDDGRLTGSESEREARAHVIPEALPMLAEAFSAAGYATAGFVNQGHMADYFGFGQGFDVYDAGLQDGLVHRRFREWIDATDGPFFAYLHFLNLHYPYRPRDEENLFVEEPGRVSELIHGDQAALRELIESGALDEEEKEELEALYDGRIRNVDRWAGHVVTDLRERGLLDSTVVVVTADHGEAFFEHGAFEHGADILYSEVVRVPLILRFPGARWAGTRVPAPVQLIDLYPTLLRAVGLEVGPTASGHSLLPRIEGDERRWPVLTEVVAGDGPRALYLGAYKYLFRGAGGDVEVYDWAADPADRVDLAASVDPALVEEARRGLAALLEENAAFSESASRMIELRPEELKKLRDLGYIR